MRQRVLVIGFFLLSLSVSGQTGGKTIFNFLNLFPAPRVAALGGINVTTYDKDPTLAWQNPALLNPEMHSRLSLNFMPFLGGVSQGMASYASTWNKVGYFHGGVQFVSYGDLTRRDIYGKEQGQFGASDIAIGGGVARDFDRFHFGTNLKLVNSNIAGYSSYGFGLDMGGTYLDTAKGFSVGAVVSNIGLQVDPYAKQGEREKLPFDFRLGLTKKLAYLPLQVSLTGVELNHFGQLRYQDPDAPKTYDLAGNEIVPKKNTFDRYARHFIIGLDFFVAKNLMVRAGYNHRRRQELKIAGSGGLVGFNFGLGVRVSKFSFDYAYSDFHETGGLHSFGLTTALNAWMPKK